MQLLIPAGSSTHYNHLNRRHEEESPTSASKTKRFTAIAHEQRFSRGTNMKERVFPQNHVRTVKLVWKYGCSLKMSHFQSEKYLLNY